MKIKLSKHTCITVVMVGGPCYLLKESQLNLSYLVPDNVVSFVITFFIERLMKKVIATLYMWNEKEQQVVESTRGFGERRGELQNMFLY